MDKVAITNKRILAATAIDSLRAILGRGKHKLNETVERGLALNAATQGQCLPLDTFNLNKWRTKNASMKVWSTKNASTKIAVSMGWLQNLRSKSLGSTKLTGQARTELEADWGSALKKYDRKRLRRG